MDEIAAFNKARWEALARANVLYSRPALGLDPDAARDKIDPEHVLGDVAGKDVFCLASGGGQQSVAFALLGANVTVFDLSETQLQRDQEASAHYKVDIRTKQGDMRDLSRFASDSFDIVWQPYSVNFAPAVQPVFREVARVLRVDGFYHLQFANPFVVGLTESDWNGDGYPLRRLYENGELHFSDPDWEIHDSESGTTARVPGPREFCHTLSTVMNSLIRLGFVLLHVSDYTDFYPDANAEPGTWDHFVAFAPPWLTLEMAYRPYVLADWLLQHSTAE